MRCADPIEPDYHNDKRIGYISLRPNKQPCIYSHAHGGILYTLVQPIIDITIQQGQMYLATNQTMDILKSRDDFFLFGSSLASIKENRLTIVDDLLSHQLGSIIQYYDHKRKPINPKSELINDVINLVKEESKNKPKNGFREITATSDIPFLRSDGTVCDKEGYDEQSKVFLLEDYSYLNIPENPSIDEVKQALQFIWDLIKTFNFDSKVSMSVYLAELLTVPSRKSMPVSPGCAFDAPTSGSGKTLLAHLVSILVIGKKFSVMPPTKSEEEKRKALLSLLIDNTQLFCIDNIKGAYESSSLEAFLTAPEFTDRVLSKSEMKTLPNRCMTLFTGNNINFKGDLNRRILKVRIDTGCERPYERDFDFDIKQYFIDNRIRIISQLLTIIRGYMTSGAGRITKTGMGSFEEWDRIVRQTVCWLSTIQTDIPLADPCLCIANNYQEDEESQQRSILFTAWYNLFGSELKSSQDIINFISTSFDSDAQKISEVLTSLSHNKPLNANSLGIMLGKFKDTISGNFKFVKANKNNSSLWKIELLK
jgi:hypothetical protein